MDTSLGHFSFAKFVMWSDIHNHAAELAQNKVIDSLLHGGRKWTPKNEEITEANIEQIICWCLRVLIRRSWLL